jgi:hyperosmotically inducible protein
MINKLASVGTVLAFVVAGSGCNQTSPPTAVQPVPPAAVASPAASTGTQAAAPSDPTRLPGPAEATGRQVGEAFDDATITTKVKSALLQAPDVKGLDVKVETDKSVVQLSGFVANQAQIDKAVELAKGVQGVREVQNKMSVKPS